MPARTQKLYLDTSVVSALFDNRTPERKLQTEQFWLLLSEYQVFISDLVYEEIHAASDKVRQMMIEKIKNFQILEINEEVETLTEEYIQYEIFIERYKNDALHVAVAVLNNIDILVSWNFKHLVKIKTRKMVKLVNEILGYNPIEIIAPPEL